VFRTNLLIQLPQAAFLKMSKIRHIWPKFSNLTPPYKKFPARLVISWVEYTLSENSWVEIDLFDLIGQW